MAPLVRLVAAADALDGRGHVARELSLAEALRARRPDAVLELDLLRGRLTEGEARRAADLGVTMAAATATAAGSIVVVDLPEPDDRPAGTSAAGIIVFDDRNHFAGRADIVIQPSLPDWSGAGSAERVLVGYGYVPIGAAYRRLRPASPSIGDPNAGLRVLACFGGSDPSRVTERLAVALGRIAGITLEIVVGAGYDGPLDGWPVAPLRDPPDLADRLARADVAVLGAGTMKFEAALLGRPSVLLAVADDQLEVGPVFAATGAALYLGDGRAMPASRVTDSVASLLADGQRRAAMSAEALRVVDGLGADRIAAAAFALADR